jgi:hypothetical protein
MAQLYASYNVTDSLEFQYHSQDILHTTPPHPTLPHIYSHHHYIYTLSMYIAGYLTIMYVCTLVPKLSPQVR